MLLYAQGIDENLKPVGTKVLIDEINYSDTKTGRRFECILSEDNDKLLIKKVGDTPKSNNHTISYNVIDKDLKSVYKSEVTLPYKINNIKGKSYMSNVAFLSKFKNDIIYLFGNAMVEENDNEKDPLYKEVIISYNLKTNKLSTFNVDAGGLGFHNIDYYFNKKNQLMLVGLASESKVKNNKYLFADGKFGEAITNGAFVWTLNNDGSEVIKKSIRNFNNGKYLNYSIYDINEFEDGSIGFICRKFIRFVHTYKNQHNVLRPKTLLIANGALITENIYKYKNVLVFNVNTDESNYWIKTFEINQESKEDNDRSIFGTVAGKGNTKDNDGFYIHSMKTLNTGKNVNILINNKVKNEIVIKPNENIELGSLGENDAVTRLITFNSKGDISTYNLTEKFGALNPVLLTNAESYKLSKTKNLEAFITANGNGETLIATITIK